MNNEKTILTISIPTWNRAMLLNDLIYQLSSQITDYNLSEKIEVLISNNGSADNTEDIAEDYIKKFSFAKYNNNKINIGLRDNVIKSMELAEGEYILLLGDDDRLRKDCLPDVIDFLEKNPETGLILDSSTFKKNPFQNNSEISLNQLLEKFFWHMGNAGVFIVKTSCIKEILKQHPYEYFNTSWPQTQLMILGLNQNKNLKIYLYNFELTSEVIHGEVTVYSSYYLWRTCYLDLFNSIESIKSLIDEATLNAAKKYLSNNLIQLFYNVLQCGVFVDDKEMRRKTVKNISENLCLFGSREKFYFRVITIALSLPSPVARIISNSFIFSIRGIKGIKKKNEFVKNELLKKTKIKKTDNLAVREFQF